MPVIVPVTVPVCVCAVVGRLGRISIDFRVCKASPALLRRTDQAVAVVFHCVFSDFGWEEEEVGREVGFGVV